MINLKIISSGIGTPIASYRVVSKCWQGLPGPGQRRGQSLGPADERQPSTAVFA